MDPNEKDRDGNPHIPHRYRQFGMMFDDAGELIGEEKPVPPDEETEDMMRERLRAEIRKEIEEENRLKREKMAGNASKGGVDAPVDSEPNPLVIGTPKRRVA